MGKQVPCHFSRELVAFGGVFMCVPFLAASITDAVRTEMKVQKAKAFNQKALTPKWGGSGHEPTSWEQLGGFYDPSFSMGHTQFYVFCGIAMLRLLSHVEHRQLWKLCLRPFRGGIFWGIIANRRWNYGGHWWPLNTLLQYWGFCLPWLLLCFWSQASVFFSIQVAICAGCKQQSFHTACGSWGRT